jgi:hypothetical protein
MGAPLVGCAASTGVRRTAIVRHCPIRIVDRIYKS